MVDPRKDFSGSLPCSRAACNCVAGGERFSGSLLLWKGYLKNG
ncbi:hypothetical protein [Eikenella sp. Marseille-P7795]|nr:hypothetical protein [Eikenella sp. Marseille-P7795]